MKTKVRLVTFQVRLAVLLFCLSLSINGEAAVQAPHLILDGDNASLEWESAPDWYLQYSTLGPGHGVWKMVPGTVSVNHESIPILEDRYFFRLVAGTPFFEVALPTAGGTVTLDNGLSITVPEGAWHSNETGYADLKVHIRLLKAVEADSIIRNTGELNKVFLGGFEIKLLDDLGLHWDQPVSVQFPTVEPLGTRTLPLAATLSLEHGIFNLLPLEYDYNFDNGIVDLHITEFLPTAPGTDYRDSQDSLVYCLLGVNPDSEITQEQGSGISMLNMDLSTGNAFEDTLPPEHPCRVGLLSSIEGALDFHDEGGCQYSIVKGVMIFWDCGDEPIHEPYEATEVYSHYLRAELDKPVIKVGEENHITATFVTSEGKVVQTDKITYASLDPDIVEVLDPKSGDVEGVSCGTGLVEMNAPCGVRRTIQVPVESNVGEVLVTPAEVVLDFDETARLEVILLDHEGVPYTLELFAAKPQETDTYTARELLPSKVDVTAKRKGGTRQLMITAGCKDSDGDQPPSVPIRVEVVEPDLSISPTSVFLGIGESVPFRVSLRGKNDTPLPQKNINWSSTLGRSCSFDSNTYLLTALDHGAGVLTAEYKGLKATCDVLVAGYLVLNPTEADIHVGEELDIEVYMFDVHGNQLPIEDQMQNILWSVSPNGIISFEAGQLKVTGLEIGTAELTATIAQQSFTSTINVVYPSLRVHWNAHHSGYASHEYYADNGSSGSESISSHGYWSGRCELKWIDGSYVLTSASVSGGQTGHREYYVIGVSDGGSYSWERVNEKMSSMVNDDPMTYLLPIESWANSTDFSADTIFNPLPIVGMPMAHFSYEINSGWGWGYPWGSDSGGGSASDEWDTNLGASLLGGDPGLGFFTGIPEENTLTGGLDGRVFSGVFNLDSSIGTSLLSTVTPYNYEIHLEVYVFLND